MNNYIRWLSVSMPNIGEEDHFPPKTIDCNVITLHAGQ